jgi:hypothetical protein
MVLTNMCRRPCLVFLANIKSGAVWMTEAHAPLSMFVRDKEKVDFLY